MFTDLGDLFASMIAEASIFRWPSNKYAGDPVGFCEQVLGFECWSRQVEILEAVRDNQRTAVSSGQKCGKSRIAAGAALWYYSTVPNGRVFLTAPRAFQTQGILWPEISQLWKGSGRCLDCRLRYPDGPRPCEHSATLDGELSSRSTTGLRGAEDGRIVTAITSKTVEALAGWSGPQLWVLDEASGIDDSVFDVIDGNGLGGGLKVLMLSNPTKNNGRMFEVFHSRKRAKAYYRVTMSAEEAAQARNRQGEHFGHLARQSEIDERRAIWTEDSPLYIIRVKGQHALGEDGAVFSVEKIGEAQARWHEDPGEGRLYIGVDPAGESGLGDESAFAIRRGTKILKIETKRGMTVDQHLEKITQLITDHGKSRETPVVVVDREGAIGSVLHSRIIEYLDRYRAPRKAPWEYVPVKASKEAERMAAGYPRVRDELIANLELFLRRGGSLPDDDLLAKELNSVNWHEQLDQRLKATSKDELRRILDRSPDRMDCVSLACWESISLRVDSSTELPPSAQAAVDRDRRAIQASRVPAGGWEGFASSDDDSTGRARRDPHAAFAAQRGGRPGRHR